MTKEKKLSLEEKLLKKQEIDKKRLDLDNEEDQLDIDISQIKIEPSKITEEEKLTHEELYSINAVWRVYNKKTKTITYLNGIQALDNMDYTDTYSFRFDHIYL